MNAGRPSPLHPFRTGGPRSGPAGALAYESHASHGGERLTAPAGFIVLSDLGSGNSRAYSRTLSVKLVLELPLVRDSAAREYGIGFIDEDFGWVGTMNHGFETRDGGRSWRPVDLGKAVNRIRIVGGKGGPVAYAIGTGLAKWMSPQRVGGRDGEGWLPNEACIKDTPRRRGRRLLDPGSPTRSRRCDVSWFFLPIFHRSRLLWGPVDRSVGARAGRR